MANEQQTPDQEQKAQGYYKHHIFFCTNERAPTDERGDCARHGALDALDYIKGRAHGMGLLGQGKVRINKAGCLDRCGHGPVCVVYPDNVWYQYVDQSDLDEILTEHLQNGRVVERLLIDDVAST